MRLVLSRLALAELDEILTYLAPSRELWLQPQPRWHTVAASQTEDSIPC